MPGLLILKLSNGFSKQSKNIKQKISFRLKNLVKFIWIEVSNIYQNISNGV